MRTAVAVILAAVSLACLIALAVGCEVPRGCCELKPAPCLSGWSGIDVAADGYQVGLCVSPGCPIGDAVAAVVGGNARLMLCVE
jgi:hypothetical protein